MVATTILYFLPENQSLKRSNGACGLPSPVWQGLRAPVACAPLAMSLPSTVDSAAPRSCSDDGGGEGKGVCVAVANASGRDRDLSETPRSSKVYRSSGRPGYGQSPHSTMVIIEPEASLRTLLREVPELEGSTTWLKPRIATKDFRLLTWRSRRVSRWTSGISSSDDMGPA
jgi:hypothetical protein